MKHVPLRRRDGSIRAHVLIDDGDHAAISQYRWSLSGSGYAHRRKSVGYVYLHQALTGVRSVDHKNGNRLDNQRRNLRPATNQENSQNRSVLNRNNTSGHRGVSWDSWSGRWRAVVKLDGRQRNLGRFDTVEEAARAVSEFRRQHMPFSEADHV